MMQGQAMKIMNGKRFNDILSSTIVNSIYNATLIDTPHFFAPFLLFAFSQFISLLFVMLSIDLTNADRIELMRIEEIPWYKNVKM